MIKRNLFILSILFCLPLFGQNKSIDSLLSVLKKQAADSNKVKTLNALSEAYSNDTIADYKAMMIYANQSIQLAKKINYTSGLARAYWCLGYGHSYDTYYYDKVVDYREGLHNYFEAEKLGLETGNKRLLTKVCYDIGDDYEYQSDYNHALEYFLKSMHYAEECGDFEKLIPTQLSIGRVYLILMDQKKSLYYFNSAYSLAIKRADTLLTIQALLKLGENHLLNKEFELSLSKFNEALSFSKKIKNGLQIGIALVDIGTVYAELKQYDFALNYYFDGFNYLKQEQGQRRSIYKALYAIAKVYFDQKKYEQALTYFHQSLTEVSDMGLSEGIAESEKSLSETYEKLGNYKLAIEYFKKSATLKDSLKNFEKIKQLTQHEMQYHYNKKDAIEKAEQTLKVKHNKLILNFSIIGLVLVLVFALFVLRSYYQKKKISNIISLEKIETERQKAMVEEKNREIISSISYAKRIQTSTLPSIEDVENKFSEAFVFFRPKDIVSGDFYWMHEKDNCIFYATADCTGHGVPGGFMSMLGSSLLNELILERNIIEPAEILNVLRSKIIRALKQKGTIGENQDGMDIIICRVDLQKKLLTYSAANNPVWIMRDGNLNEYPCNKQPVGISVGQTQPFTQQEVQLEKGDCIYTFTDGFTDQFGGADGKKFKFKRFREIIHSIHSLPMSEQKNKLGKTFDEWKGNFEQVDDVSVIGIKI